MRTALLPPRPIAIAGDVLVWLPLAAPCAFWAIGFVSGRVPVFDYLMPAELFPVAFLGAGLLLLAAFMSRVYRAAIAWSIGAAITGLVGSQALALVTGLATGERAATGWPWWTVLALLGLYGLALIVLGVCGAALANRLRHEGQTRA